MRRLAWCGIVIALTGCSIQETPAPDTRRAKVSDDCEGDCCTNLSRSALLARSSADEIGIKTVKFDAFAKDIQAHKGQIVCAYQWSEGNAASKKNLAMLVDLQKKLGQDAVFFTVSNDPARKNESVLSALKDAKCALANLRQDDEDTVDGWASTFGCCGFPALVVFDRAGKKSATFEVTELPLDPAAIEAALGKLAKK